MYNVYKIVQNNDYALKLKDIGKDILKYMYVNYPEIIMLRNIYCLHIPDDLSLYFKLKGYELNRGYQGRLCINGNPIYKAILDGELNKEEIFFIYSKFNNISEAFFCMQTSSTSKMSMNVYAESKNINRLIKDIYDKFGVVWKTYLL